MSDDWRETASDELQTQIDGLVGSGLFDAERLVEKHGEFFPFALAWVTGAPAPEVVMATDEDIARTARPDSTHLIELLVEALRNRRAELDGIALVTDIYLNRKPAICVAVEHREGIHHALVRRYERKRFRRGGVLGELGRLQTTPSIWGVAD